MLRCTCVVRGLLSVVTVAVLATAAFTQTDNAKALKYHSILVERPAPGYLFDRFVDTWLDTGTLAGLQEFLESQVKQSDTTNHRLVLALFHAKQGDDVEALRQFRAALNRDAANAQIWYQKALIEARNLDFDTAVVDLEHARKAKPDEKLAIDIAKLLGTLNVRNQQPERAIATWQSLLEENPNDDLYEDVIELQIAEGLYDEAAKLSEELVLRTNDKYKQVIRKLRTADIYERVGKRGEVLEVYTTTLEQVGQGSWIEREILAQVERLFRQEDDLSGLQLEYEKLLKRYPRRIELRKNYARLLAELGDTDSALKQFDEILRLTPGDRKNGEAYVAILVGSGRLAEALAALKTLIEQHPRDGELRFQQARLHGQAEDKDAAAAAVQSYLDVSDQSEYAYLRAARTLQQLELYDEAEKTYEQLSMAFPDSFAAKEALAAFLYDRKKKEKAIAIWKMLADGKDRPQLVRVARILSSRNEHATAFEMLLARQDDFQNDSVFLGQIVAEAIAVERFQQAIPWARRRVQLSRGASELETAIGQIVGLAQQSKTLDQLVAELRTAKPLSANETCLLAELYEHRGESQLAEQTLQQFGNQQEPLIAHQQIRLYMQRQDWPAAIAALKQLVQLPEGRKSLYIRRLVELLQREYKLDEALHWVQQWKKLAPGSTQPYLVQSRLLVQQDKLDEAIRVLRTAAQRFDDDDLRARLAVLYSDSGKLADAERVYWRLYNEGKDLNGKLRWVPKLAEAAELQGKSKQLIVRFNQRRRNNRQSVEPLLALAEIHRASLDHEEQRKALLEAARIKGDDLPLLQKIARVEQTAGDWERALATLERAASMDPTNRSREQIAQLLINNGDPDKGYAMLYELANNPKTDARGIETLAAAMLEVGDWERGADFLTSQLRRFPDDFRLRYLLAIAQEESGQVENATKNYVRLLDGQKEIPGLSPVLPFQLGLPDYLADYVEIFPAESCEYIEIGWLGDVVYSHFALQSRSHVNYPYGFGIRSSRPQLPRDVESVRKFSLAHLVRIAPELSGAQAHDLSEMLRDKGVANPALLIEVAPNLDDDNMLDLLVETHSDDEGFLALYIAMTVDEFEPGDGPLLVKAYNMFKEKHPQLALLAAVALASLDNEQTGPLDESLRTMAEIKTPKLILFDFVARSLGGEDEDEEWTLPKKYRRTLTNQLVQWYQQFDVAFSQSEMLFGPVAKAVSNSEEPKEFFAFLDKEITRWRASSQVNAAASSYPFNAHFHFGHDEPFIQRIELPPRGLSDFPPHVIELIIGEESNLGSHGPQGQEILEPQLATISDPILKCLVAHQLGYESVVEMAIDEMLNAESVELDALLLAASKASSKGDDVRAVQLFEQARFRPMRQAIRRTIDSALVAIALDAIAAANSKADDKPSGTIDVGRSAALRLRRVNLFQSERQTLVGVLADLGLADESERLEESIYASGSSGYSIPAASSRSQADQITQLVDNGKQDQAVRAIVNRLRRIGTSAMTAAKTFSHESGGLQFSLIVQSHGLADDALEQLKPNESANVLKLGQYAVACELFGRNSEAQSAYERALAIRPKDDGTRFRLIMLLMEEGDYEAAIAQFEKCEIRHACDIAVSLVETVEHIPEITDAVKVASLLNRFVAGIEHKERYDLGWVATLTEHIANWRFYDAENELQQEFVQVSGKTFDDLCRTMLAIPQLAQEGFSYSLAAVEVDKGNVNELVPIARRVLIAANANSIEHTSEAYRSAYEPSGEGLTLITAKDFLIQRAWKTNNPRLIEEDIVPALKQANKSRLAREILGEYELLTCPENEFLAQAMDFVNTAPPGEDEYFQAVSTVIGVHSARKLKTNIDSLVIEFITKTDEVDAGPMMAYWYAKALPLESGQDQLPRFIEALEDEFLGPKNERKARVQKYFESESRSSRKNRELVIDYCNIMNTLCFHRELFFVGLKSLHDHGLISEVSDLRYRLHIVLSSEDDLHGQPPEAEQHVRLLEASPFLGSVDDLLVYPVADKYRHTIMGAVIDHLVEFPSDTKKKISQALSRRNEFGSRLISTYLAADQQDQPAAIVDLLAEYEEQLPSLSESKQREFVLLMDDLLNLEAFPPNYRADGMKAKDGATRIREWLGSFRTRDRDALVKDLFAANSWDDLDVDAYVLPDGSNLDESIVSLLDLKHLVPSDRQRAEKVVSKLTQLDEEFRKRHGGTDSIVNSIVYHLMDGELSLAESGFLLDLVFNANQSDAIVEPWWADEITHPIRSAYAHAQQSVEPDEQYPQLESAKRLYAMLGVHFRSVPTTILAPQYYAIFDAWPLRERQAFIAWADKEARDGSHRSIARELAAAARVYGDETEQASSQRYYLDTMQNDELPLAWRYAIAVNLLESYPLEIEGKLCDTPRAFVMQSARLLQQVFGERGMALDDDAIQILKHFIALDEDEDWIALAKSLTEAWNKPFLARTGQRKYHACEYSSFALLFESFTVPLMLKLNLRFGNDQWVARMLRAFDERLGRDQQTFALLVRHGRHAIAAKKLRTVWNEISIPDDQMNTYQFSRYDRSLHDAIPVFLETLSEPDLRYIARLFLELLPDTNETDQQAPLKLESRVKSLANEFASVQFRSPARKEQALLLLCNNNQAAALLHDEMAKLGENVNLAAVFGLQNDYVRERKKSIVGAHLRAIIAEGDFKVLISKLDELSKVEQDFDPFDGRKWNWETHLGHLIRDSFERILANGTPEEIAAMLPAVRRMALLEGLVGKTYLSYAIVSHVLAGRTDELNAWWAELSPMPAVKDLYDPFARHSNQRRPMESEIWSVAAAIVGEPDEANLPRRVDILTAILRTPVASESFGWSEQQVAHLPCETSLADAIIEEGELLSEDEFLAHGSEIATAAPLNGMTWAALAQRQALRFRNEPALESWNKAIAASPPDAKQTQTDWRRKKASILKRLGRLDEAAERLKEADRDSQGKVTQSALDKSNR